VLLNSSRVKFHLCACEVWWTQEKLNSLSKYCREREREWNKSATDWQYQLATGKKIEIRKPTAINYRFWYLQQQTGKLSFPYPFLSVLPTLSSTHIYSRPFITFILFIGSGSRILLRTMSRKFVLCENLVYFEHLPSRQWDRSAERSVSLLRIENRMIRCVKRWLWYYELLHIFSSLSIAFTLQSMSFSCSRDRTILNFNHTLWEINCRREGKES
jgi:hypothetical protein